MTLVEFSFLSFEEKHEFVFGNKNVRLISFREYYNQKVTLFDCGSFFAKYENQAKKKIYFVEYENQADLKIFFVEYENQAGWKEKKKIHLMY